MKTKLSLCGLLLGCCTVSYAQNTFPSSGNVGIGTTSPSRPLEIRRAAQAGGAETFMRFHVSDAPGDELIMDNGTLINGNFIPVIRGSRSTDNRFALMLSGVVADPAMDSGDSAIVAFDARLATGKINTRPLFVWQSYTTPYMTLSSNGNLGIGTVSPQAKLSVEGNIVAREIRVRTDISVPDYVFEPDYKLTSLSEIQYYVKQHKHLPEIPSAKEIGEQGLDLAEMNLLLLKKVEELTLHLIDERANREEHHERIKLLEAKIETMALNEDKLL